MNRLQQALHHRITTCTALEELPVEQATNAPGDYDNEKDYEEYAYSYFNHSDVEIDGGSRFTTGPSLDGKSEFRVADPAPALGTEPELAKAPPATHSGVEASAPAPNEGVVDKVKDTVGKVTS